MQEEIGKREAATLARRKHIVEMAALCFIEQGFHQTSIRDIAGKAGVSLGNLYNHFDSKVALIAEIAMLEAEGLARVAKKLRGKGGAIKRVERFVAAYFDSLSKPENAVLTAEIMAEAMRNPQVAARFAANRQGVVTALCTVLQQGRGQGAFGFEIEPVEMAELLLDMIEATGMRMAFAKRGQRARAKQALLAVLRDVL